jgi:NAD(P)-dependent dehydrogenase (short-subunit alcohol dehydrogenase family)
VQVVRESIEVFKRIDILIHSAGIYVPRRFSETDLATLDRQWAINVRAAFALTQEALPELIRRRGKVIFVSSIDGHVGFAGDTAYAATKGAVDALVRALGMELASLNVRVNALAPGFTATPMNREARADVQVLESVTSATPLKRLATVEDIAHAALFLASDAAAFIVGTVLNVDGGYPASVVQQGAEDPVPPPS